MVWSTLREEWRRGLTAVAIAALTGRFLRGLLRRRRRDARRARDSVFLRRGATGTEVERTVTIGRPVEEVYEFARQEDNLRRLVLGRSAKSPSAAHPIALRVLDRLSGVPPSGVEVLRDRENEEVRWRSLEARATPAAGVLRLHGAPGGRGTEVALSFEFPRTPALLAPLARRRAVRRVGAAGTVLKQLLETGEVATTEGQPSARAGDP
jgi:uncharacterized membrane protein